MTVVRISIGSMAALDLLSPSSFIIKPAKSKSTFYRMMASDISHPVFDTPPSGSDLIII
jgi:hypothetical protein